jgi:hypothetical protein
MFTEKIIDSILKNSKKDVFQEAEKTGLKYWGMGILEKRSK